MSNDVVKLEAPQNFEDWKLIKPLHLVINTPPEIAAIELILERNIEEAREIEGSESLIAEVLVPLYEQVRKFLATEYQCNNPNCTECNQRGNMRRRHYNLLTADELMTIYRTICA